MSNDAFPTHADWDPRYYRKFILLGIGALCACAWFVYDGYIGYPKKAEIWKAYTALDEETRGEEWPEIAREHGWPELAPNEHKYNMTASDMTLQLLLAVPLGLAGIWFLLFVLLARGSWIESDNSGVASSRGSGFKWEEVVELDKKKWRSKGIARVHYERNGRRNSFVLDDFKYQREPTGEILRKLEDRIPREMIVNGPSEAEVKAEKAPEDTTDHEEPS